MYATSDLKLQFPTVSGREIEMADWQRRRFEEFIDLLLQENQKMNLTGTLKTFQNLQVKR